MASGAVPDCAVDDTLTRLITSFAFGDNCAGSRKATVPLTTLVVTAAAALPDAATPALPCCDEEDALHPAKTNAASDVSDKTSLRMGKTSNSAFNGHEPVRRRNATVIRGGNPEHSPNSPVGKVNRTQADSCMLVQRHTRPHAESIQSILHAA
ncbi:hypothetical protein GCM10009126_13190 [Rhodanobacter caeni]|uniref:Uncharacterized protein n=1 Tax=Rhodanobacter caeni TaxID=657654 RepID=A0ABN0UFQ9_9GAMM